MLCSCSNARRYQLVYKIYLLNIFLNYLGNGPPGPALQAEWADSWRALVFLFFESSWRGTHDTKSRQ
jgi:hypothetical protein